MADASAFAIVLVFVGCPSTAKVSTTERESEERVSLGGYVEDQAISATCPIESLASSQRMAAIEVAVALEALVETHGRSQLAAIAAIVSTRHATMRRQTVAPTLVPAVEGADETDAAPKMASRVLVSDGRAAALRRQVAHEKTEGSSVFTAEESEVAAIETKGRSPT